MSKRARGKDFVIAKCGATVKQRNFDRHYRNCRKCRGKELQKKPWQIFHSGKDRIALDLNEDPEAILNFKTKEKL